MFEDLLYKIHGWIQSHEKPPEPARYCSACLHPILDEPIFWEGKPFCAYSCVPAIRRHNREADLLERARQGGV